jgi:hypothetical protein
LQRLVGLVLGAAEQKRLVVDWNSIESDGSTIPSSLKMRKKQTKKLLAYLCSLTSGYHDSSRLSSQRSAIDLSSGGRLSCFKAWLYLSGASYML